MRISNSSTNYALVNRVGNCLFEQRTCAKWVRHIFLCINRMHRDTGCLANCDFARSYKLISQHCIATCNDVRFLAELILSPIERMQWQLNSYAANYDASIRSMPVRCENTKIKMELRTNWCLSAFRQNRLIAARLRMRALVYSSYWAQFHLLIPIRWKSWRRSSHVNRFYLILETDCCERITGILCVAWLSLSLSLCQPLSRWDWCQGQVPQCSA